MTNKDSKWEKLGLSDNFIFQKVMQNKELCKEVLERILGIKLLKVEMVTTEKTIQNAFQSKGIRVDAYVNDSKGTVYNVEAQTENIKDVLPKRIRYYQSNIDQNLLQPGDDYSELKDVFIIFICNFDPIGLKYSQYRFKTISPDDHSIVLDDGRTIILLYSHGVNENINQGVRNILELFNGNKVEGDDLIDRMNQAIQDIKERKEFRMEWTRMECDRQDQRRIGKAEGKIEEKIETATRMLKQGKFSLEDIAEALDIPFEKVQELAEGLKEA